MFFPEWIITVNQVELLRQRKYPSARPETNIQERTNQSYCVWVNAQMIEISRITPIGPREVSDQPRNRKPRKMNSSIIGPAIQPPTNNIIKPPAPATLR